MPHPCAMMTGMDPSGEAASVSLHCIGELQDFLAPARRGQCRTLRFRAPTPVRHLAETQGIPHTEIGRVSINGMPAGLEDPVGDGDRVELWPVLEEGAEPAALEARPRFLADAHLGKLSGYLRLLGFDTKYHNDLGDALLAESSTREQRILLSRDRDLLMRRTVTRGCYLRPNDPWQQLQYLVRRLGLCEWIRPFSRCMRCNGSLAEVAKQDVVDQVPPGVANFQERYWRCQGCGQVYWQGSHWRVLADRVEALCGQPAD